MVHLSTHRLCQGSSPSRLYSCSPFCQMSKRKSSDTSTPSAKRPHARSPYRSPGIAAGAAMAADHGTFKLNATYFAELDIAYKKVCQHPVFQGLPKMKSQPIWHGGPRHHQVQVKHRPTRNTHMWRQPLLGRRLLHSDAWRAHQPSRGPLPHFSPLINTHVHTHSITPHKHTPDMFACLCNMQGRLLSRILLQQPTVSFLVWISSDYRCHT